MTEEAKKNLLDYMLGKMPSESGADEILAPNVEEISNSIDAFARENYPELSTRWSPEQLFTRGDYIILWCSDYDTSDISSPTYMQWKKTFVIVLDKNYNKEDIAPKKEPAMTYTSTSISIDEVRKKAYGTLEDDLESTLVGNSLKEPIKEEDLFDELIEEAKPSKEEPINIIDDDINMLEEEMDNKKDSPISESELFDLIDSMYEKGDNNGNRC